MAGILTASRLALLLSWAAMPSLLQAQTIDVPTLTHSWAAGITPVPRLPDIVVTVTATLTEFIYPEDDAITYTATTTIWPATINTTFIYGCTSYFWFAYPQSPAFTYSYTKWLTETITDTTASWWRTGFTTVTYITRTRYGAQPSVSTVYSCNRTLVNVDINTAPHATVTLTQPALYRTTTDLTTACHYTTRSLSNPIGIPPRTTTMTPPDTRVWTTSISTEIRDNTHTDYATKTVEDSVTTTLVQTWCLNPTTTLYVRTRTLTTMVYTATVDRYWDDSYCSFIASSRSAEEALLLPDTETMTAPPTTTSMMTSSYRPAPASVFPTAVDSAAAGMVRRRRLSAPTGESTAGVVGIGMETFTVTIYSISTTTTLRITAETPATRYVQECLPLSLSSSVP